MAMLFFPQSRMFLGRLIRSVATASFVLLERHSVSDKVGSHQASPKPDKATVDVSGFCWLLFRLVKPKLASSACLRIL